MRPCYIQLVGRTEQATRSPEGYHTASRGRTCRSRRGLLSVGLRQVDGAPHIPSVQDRRRSATTFRSLTGRTMRAKTEPMRKRAGPVAGLD
jgi:hypothetical protein